jgi:hypothetical protein
MGDFTCIIYRDWIVRDKQNGEAAGTSRMGKLECQAEWGSWNDKQNGEAGMTSRKEKQQREEE